MTLPKMKIHFAPLQGYTTATYRRLHNAMWGGIEQYYTPFVRIEKGGFRSRDLADIAPQNNSDTPVIPQMLPANAQEMHTLSQLFISQGYDRADVNMGCPFPPIALHGRGSGLLQHPHNVKDILQVMREYPQLKFSVKMRLGWQQSDEWLSVIESINEAPLTHVTMHPRIGRQLYKGTTDRESFTTFTQQCTQPIIYNGDINTIKEINAIKQSYPQLAGIMMGRGLLARPHLAACYNGTIDSDVHEIIRRTETFHNTLYNNLLSTSQGDTQLLQRALSMWEYFLPHAPHKQRKAVRKATSPSRYEQAVKQLFTAWHNSGENIL